MEHINKRQSKGRRMTDEYVELIFEHIKEIKDDIKELRVQINGKFTKHNDCIVALQLQAQSNKKDIDSNTKIIWKIFIPSILSLIGVIVLTLWNIFAKHILGH